MEFLKEPQRTFLIDGNYLQGQTCEERYQQIVDQVKYYEDEYRYAKGLSERIKVLLWDNVLSPSTPVLSNFGRPKPEGRTTKPLSCSCNVVSVVDSIDGIYSANHEVAMLSKLGAGVGVDFTQIRDKDTELSEGFYSNSKLDWIEALIDTSQKVSQNSVRRGYATPFISIEDAEYNDLMDRIDKNNPDKNDVLLDNTVGVKIPQGFMAKLDDGDSDSQERMSRLVRLRKNTGKVYVIFDENMCKNISPVYEKLGLKPLNSNICCEITTPHFDDKTFACIISSLNLAHWDRINSDPQIIKDCIYFLDIIVQDYIDNSEGVRGLEKARKSAIEKRDIGLGTLGFHDLLQSKEFVFGDLQSKHLNNQIYSTVRKYSEEATLELAQSLGSPKMCQDAGMIRRNVSLMKVAPNKSSSAICGMTSPGIEPFKSNYYVRKLAKIEHQFKNPHLEKLLGEKRQNSFRVWESIMENQGSVQHLDFLSQKEKDVFKTFSEISPKDIIDLAADRQEYIDMAQSLNLMSRPNYSLKDIYEIHKYAFEKGIKTLYYFYSSSHAVFDKDGEDWDVCSSCAD